MWYPGHAESRTDTPCQHLARDSTNLSEMFLKRVEHSCERNAFFTKKDDDWIGITCSEWSTTSHRIAAGIVKLGLDPGDRVAILGPTRAGWAEFEMGAQLAGCVSLGIYPKQSVEQVRYLLSHSEAKVVFVAEADELETVDRPPIRAVG